MKIPRNYNNLNKYLEKQKALIIYGPRQVGKTTLLNDFLSSTKLRYRLDNGDNIRTQHLLGSQDLEKILAYCEGFELIAIDEAQKIPHIGTALKMMVDHVPNIRVIVTGSSSFALSGEVGEPLTGRKTTLTLFPIAQLELLSLFNKQQLGEQWKERLIFGSYPDILTASSKEQKQRRISELAESYLLKDILELEKIKNSKILLDLLRLVAFQIGSEVSMNELGSQLGIDTKTVQRYLDLLEKSFVVFNVRGFSRNLRKEITKKSKYFFYDCGIRNAIIANFNDIELRNDMGALWENFIFSERLKYRNYKDMVANCYFWRTWDQHEIDMIEEREGKLFAYELKWKEGKKTQVPHDWQKAYPESEYHVITPENFLSFIS